ncbi:MAG: DUF11 domain-containing protein [Anaerolineae bacterium]|nr:DUF11 domain-containing protein [Anaerolineae bacterium]
MKRKSFLFSMALGLAGTLLIVFSVLLHPAAQKSLGHPLVEAPITSANDGALNAVLVDVTHDPADEAVPDTRPEPITGIAPQYLPAASTGIRPQQDRDYAGKFAQQTDHAPSTLGTPLSVLAGIDAGMPGIAAEPAFIAAPPLPSDTPFVVSLDRNQVWGLVGPGSTVTVTVDGVQVGAAVADGIGFFWTTLYDDWGDQVDLVGGEALAIYENSILVAATTLRTITAQINPHNEIVTGAIGGTSSPVNVTIYTGLSGTPTVSETVWTDSFGNFTIELFSTWDFFADETATLAYLRDGIEVYHDIYGSRLAVLPFPFGTITAKTTPNVAVTATVYLSDGVTIRDQAVDTTSADNGYFNLTPDFGETDIIVVEVEGGIVMSRTVEHYTPPIIDAANDRILGEAAPGAVVRGRASNLTTNGYQHVSNATVADATGVYTIEFGGIANLMPGNWGGVYSADAEGDDLALWAPAQGSVDVNQVYDSVNGYAIAPPGHMAIGHLVTLTLTSASDGMTYVYDKGTDEWGNYTFNPDDGLPDIAPGDVITVESDGYGWQGVVEVMTVIAEADTANDRFTGTVEPSIDRVEIWGEHWDGWSNQVLYPVGGTFDILITAGSPFSADVVGFDVRNAVVYEINHRTADEYIDRITQLVDYVRVWPGYNGVLGSLRPGNTPYTITLRDSGGGFKAQLTGTSFDDGSIGFNDFNSENVQIEASDEIQIQSSAGFDQVVVIPDLLAQMDEASDRVTGHGPPNSLLNVNLSDQGSGFVPTDENGDFAIVPDQLQDFYGNGDLEWGQSVRLCYQNEDANQVCQNFDWPQIVANYRANGYNEVWGSGATPGSTLLITITESGGAVVDTGTTLGGSGDQGPTSYRLEFPDNTIQPGRVVWVDFGNGIVEYVEVVAITGYPDIDTDIVTGTAPANNQIHINVDCRDGGCWSTIDGVQVDSSGVYTADFASDGNPPHDIWYGDRFNVHHAGNHNHQTQYSFEITQPDVYIEKQTTPGIAVPGETYLYRIYYGNQESGIAENVTIVDDLPANTTYADNSAGFPVDDGGSVVTFTVGDIPPYTNLEFYVAVNVDGGTPPQTDLENNCVTIATTSPGDPDTDNDNSCSGGVWVDNADHGVWVNKGADPNDPMPGQEFTYGIDYGSDGNGANGTVWLTDTLPAGTTVVGWEEENDWGGLWTEVITTGGQFVLKAPAGIPGDMGGRIRLTLELDGGVPIGTRLENTVVITTDGDVNPDNNMYFDNNTVVSGARYDMEVWKSAWPSQQTPGGHQNYGISFNNRGNIATHAWLTDTLPEGTSLRALNTWVQSGNIGWWEPIEPATITEDYVVWDLGMVPVNENAGLMLEVDIDETATPGPITNCAEIGGDFLENTPANNTHCAESMVYPEGPNLRVTKWHEWRDNYGRLQYVFDVQNVGDMTINNVLITDTLPADATFNGNRWWEGWFPWNVTFTDDSGNGQLLWELEQIDPGWSLTFYFEMDLDNPGEPMQWFTNTVEITTPTGDPTPADNIYTDVAFSRGEVDRVDIQMYPGSSADIRGNAVPGWVTVTTPYTEVVVWADPGCNGCWDTNGASPLEPGDTLVVAAGEGSMPITIEIPDPFTAEADSTADIVYGQIGGWLNQQVNVNIHRPGGNQNVWTDDSGNFTATYGDVPRASQGDVRIETMIDYAAVNISQRFRTRDLSLNVNYGHDWVEGEYEAGHTLWITVTDSGGSIKATAEMTTGVIPWWGDRTGFSSNLGDPWSPERPDIEAGDWVHGALDNGYTNSLHIGDITGVVDSALDNIEGTVLAPEIAQVIDIECHTWGADGWAPNKQDNVYPDGIDTYYCGWDPGTEWDIQPGQEIGVSYYEPDRDQVFNAFHEPAPYLRIQKESYGAPAEGGNFLMRIQYRNEGDAAAENVVISDTILYGMTYLTDTSGLPHTGTGTSGDPLMWDLGTLDPGEWIEFYVFTHVTASAGQQVGNSASISSSTYDPGDPNDRYTEMWSDVQSNDTHLNVGKNAWTGDPLPDSDFVWAVNVCNNGSTTSTGVTVTDTLPMSTTLVNWWGQYPGWTEVFNDGSNLVVTYPAIPSGWCNEVYLIVHVWPDVQPGTQLWNSAVISASNDLESDDNETSNDVWVGEPHTNLSINKDWSWGQLVPGGELSYNIGYHNNGNVAINDTIHITDTLPVSTTFREAWHHDQGSSTPVVPVLITSEYVVWEISGLPNGYGDNFEVRLNIDAAAQPGTVLTNTVKISPQPDEDSYEDNVSHWSETLNDHGPNLRVHKSGGWDDWGENTRQAWWNVTVENIGDDVIAPVLITDTYPADMYMNSGVGLNYWRWWNWGDDPANHSLTVTLESLYPGERIDFNFYTITDTEPLPFGLIFTNTVEVGNVPDDTNSADNTADAVLTTGPDLYVEKDLVAGNFLPGELVTFSLTFGNNNEHWQLWWNMTGDAWLTDTLPVEMEYVTSTLRWCGGSNWCPWMPAIDGNDLTWHLGQMNGGDWNEVHLTARITETVDGLDSFTNWVEIASDQPMVDIEPFYDNNVDSYEVAIDLPYFEVSKAYESTAVAGQPITYTLTVINTGNGVGTGIVLSDTIPAGLENVSGGTIIQPWMWWYIDELVAGGVATETLAATLPCQGTVINDDYRVVDSDQGVSSAVGAPVSFAVLAPTLDVGFNQSAATALVNTTLYFTDTSTTNGPAIAEWTWDFGDDSAPVFTQNASHTYITDGTFTVTLTVTDTCGYAATTTGMVTVTAPTLVASFTQSAASTVVSTTVHFTDTSTTDVPPIAAWAWDFGDASAPVLTQDASHTYSTDGDFTVKLTVTDTLGYTDFYTSLVQVNPPTLAASFDQSATLTEIGVTVYFTDTSTTDVPPIAAWAWNFGDNTPLVFTQNVIHTFATKDTFTVTLTITDTLGYSDSYHATIQVETSLEYIFLPLVLRNF